MKELLDELEEWMEVHIINPDDYSNLQEWIREKREE